MLKKSQRKHTMVKKNRISSLMYRSEGKERIPLAFVTATAFLIVVSRAMRVLETSYSRIYPELPIRYSALFYLTQVIIASSIWILFYNIQYVIYELFALINDEHKYDRIKKAEIKYRLFANQFLIHLIIVVSTFYTIIMIYSNANRMLILFNIFIAIGALIFFLLRESKELLLKVVNLINFNGFTVTKFVVYFLMLLILVDSGENNIFENNIRNYEVNYIDGAFPYIELQYSHEFDESIDIQIEGESNSLKLDMTKFKKHYIGQKEEHFTTNTGEESFIKGLSNYINLNNYKEAYFYRIPVQKYLEIGDNAIKISIKADKMEIELDNVILWDGLAGTFVEHQQSRQ